MPMAALIVQWWLWFISTMKKTLYSYSEYSFSGNNSIPLSLINTPKPYNSIRNRRKLRNWPRLKQEPSRL